MAYEVGCIEPCGLRVCSNYDSSQAEDTMQPFFVYILKCSDESFYIGHTDNIEARLIQHQEATFECYTASRLPITLVFLKEFESRDEAFMVEHQIKRWSRKKKEALIAGDFPLLTQRSKKNFNS